jgi:hypothetical protein
VNSHDPHWNTHDSHWSGPLDPFHGDPNDPAFLLDDADAIEPLSELEQREVAEDLADLVQFRSALTPHGIKGIVIDCPDCEEQHYFSWALMAANLSNLLGSGQSGVHEPAANPDPDAYVSWDYARGFTDAVTSHR